METQITEFSRPNKSVPWGFSIQGGKDFGCPLSVLKVTPGSIADRLGVNMGDFITKINEIPTDTMTHQQAILQIQNLKVTLEINRPKSDFPPPPPVDNAFFNNACRVSISELPPPPPIGYISTRAPVTSFPAPPPQPSSTPNPVPPKPSFVSKSDNNKSQTIPPIVLDMEKVKLFQKETGDNNNNNKAQSSSSTSLGKFVQNQSNDPNHDSRQSNQDKQSYICSVCKEHIKGALVNANNKVYCVNHFCCSFCRQPIKGNQFIETKEGVLYCMEDFKNNVAPRCTKCNGSVIEEQVMALGKCWHPQCFLCDHCKKSIPHGQFHVKEDNGVSKVYCDRDYKEFYEVKCVACSFPIDNDDKYLLVGGKNYHTTCYKR